MMMVMVMVGDDDDDDDDDDVDDDDDDQTYLKTGQNTWINLAAEFFAMKNFLPVTSKWS